MTKDKNTFYFLLKKRNPVDIMKKKIKKGMNEQNYNFEKMTFAKK